MTDETKHKRCPWCKERENLMMLRAGVGGDFYVKCNVCGATGPTMGTATKAWALWDARPRKKGKAEGLEVKPVGNIGGCLYGDFVDLNHMACRIQENRYDAKDTVYLGQIGNGKSIHLSREMVAAMLPLLKRFVNTGKLKERDT